MSSTGYTGRHRVTEQQASTTTDNYKMVTRFAAPLAAAMAVTLGFGVPASAAEPANIYSAAAIVKVVKPAPKVKSMIVPVKVSAATVFAAVQKVLVPPPPPPPPPAPACTWIYPPNYWGDAQWANARTIYNVGVGRGISRDGEIIALMTAMQESKLFNLNYGDRDSLGLFQQRPSAGWGTPAQVTDPVYASNKFYDGLMRVANWWNLEKTWAAQDVQVSAFPYAYAQWETDATDMVTNFANCPA